MISRVTETKSPVSGASTKETVKPSCGKCRVSSGVPAVTLLACFLSLHARLRAHWCARHFPRPLFKEGPDFDEPGPRNRAAGRRGCVCKASLPLSFRGASPASEPGIHRAAEL